LIVTFLAGIHFYLSYPPYSESFTEQIEDDINNYGTLYTEPIDTEDVNAESCPDILIRKGNHILLMNSKLPNSIDNMIVFNNLDEYMNYLTSQQDDNIHCPVLYLQEETNTQGEDVYRVRPNPFISKTSQPALPATTVLHKGTSLYGFPQNKSMLENMNNKETTAEPNAETEESSDYMGFDPMGQGIGLYTKLDKIHDSTKMEKLSDNPMDPNWGGILHTQSAVASGKYKLNEVSNPNQVFSENSDNLRNDQSTRNIMA